MSTETDPAAPDAAPAAKTGERATPARALGPEPGAARGPGAWMAGRSVEKSLDFRGSGMRLLRTVKQRWGIGELALPGWSVAFKGGWTDRVPLSEHQSALLVGGPDRIAVSVLTTGEPGHAYARRTLRGVFRRLLRER